MKRFLCALLAVILLAGCACAEVDQAVGTWYAMFDFNSYPELKDSFGSYDKLLIALVFLEDGTIIEFDNTIASNSPDAEGAVRGKWEKDGDFYKYSIIGLGEGDFTIEGDIMDLYLTATKLHMIVRRAVPFNPYKDYRY